MTTRYCPSCGGEFIGDLEVCPDCDVELTDDPPEPVGEDEGATGEVAYDLAEWSMEGRRMVEQLLTSTQAIPGNGVPALEKIPYTWEGTTLVVPAAFETRVDVMVDEASAMADGVDLSGDQIVYDLDELSDAQYSALYDALEQLAVPFELDEDGALVIGIGDQAAVDEALERIEAAAATRGGYVDASGVLDGDDEDEDDGDETGADGVEFGSEEMDGNVLMQVVGDVFVACDRLVHHPTDSSSVLAFADGVEVLRRAAMPFGYEPRVWARILVTTGELLEDLESPDIVEDEVVVEKAGTVRDLLRPLV